MAVTFTETGAVTFNVETCCNCGVKFAMTASYQAARRNDRQYFYCPNGHPQHYTGPTDADRARAERDAANARAISLQAALDQQNAAVVEKNRQIDAVERRRRASVGAATRLRNRIKNGVCPCCNRTFTALAAHMKTEHPHFRPDDVEQGDAASK